MGFRAAWQRLVGTARGVGVTPNRVDLLLGVVALAVMLVERIHSAATIGTAMPLAVVLSGAMATGLALRRRAPLGGYFLGTLALSAEALLVPPSPVSPYLNLVGIYCLGLYATRRRAWWGPPLLVLGVAAYFRFGMVSAPPLAAVGVLFSWSLTWALGYTGARRREAQQVSQALMRTEAIAEERTRIARELHDLVGHAVTLMVVQAGAARRVLDDEPGRTRELLSTMENTGRDALTELDRLLGMLRRADPGGEPGLAMLSALVERMGRAGIRVTVDSDVTESRLPRSLSMCAYRIIQESLTNALRHGRAGTARVTLRHTAARLDLEVSDDGHGAPHGYREGRGLLGIGERVALFGGSVTHGGGEGGGFRLRAALPLP